MKVNRQNTELKKLWEDDNGFVDASPADRVSFLWELTAEIWSLKNPDHVKRRLPRNVVHITRQ